MSGLCESSGARLMLAFLRGDIALEEEHRLADWFVLCKTLKRHGALFVYSGELLDAAPVPVTRRIREDLRTHSADVACKLEALEAFSRMADTENLNFSLIKGPAMSMRFYGDASARDYGDIDILVEPDDIGKADYVARRAGFIEPGEAHKIRRLPANSIDETLLRNEETPYPLRSSRFLPHITNHYYPHQDGAVSILEIHDRFHGLGPDITFELLGCSQLIELAGREYLTCSDELHACLALLSLYEDAESIRANTKEGGAFGLKSLLDAHFGLRLLSGQGRIGSLEETIGALGAGHRAAVAFGDVCELFPEHECLAGAGHAMSASLWRLGYAERMCNAHLRVSNALSRLAATSNECGFPVDGTWHSLLTSHGLSSGFRCKARLEGKGFFVSWHLPAHALLHEERLALQFAAIQPCDRRFGVRIEALFDSGKWVAAVYDIDASSIDWHVGEHSGGKPCKVHCAAAGGGGLDVFIDAPLIEGNVDTRAIFTVQERIYGGLYRPCVGDDFVMAFEKAMGL